MKLNELRQAIERQHWETVTELFDELEQLLWTGVCKPLSERKSLELKDVNIRKLNFAHQNLVKLLSLTPEKTLLNKIEP